MRGSNANVEFSRVRTDETENEADDVEEGGFPRHIRDKKAQWWKQTPVLILFGVVAILSLVVLSLGYGSSDSTSHQSSGGDSQLHHQLADSLASANKLIAQLRSTVGEIKATKAASEAEAKPIEVVTAAAEAATEPLGQPHRESQFPNYQADKKELGTPTWYFDRYDSPKHSRSDIPEGEQTRWWSKDGGKTAADPAHSVGLFQFSDVSHPRFLSTPEAYEKYNRKLEYDPDVFRAATVPVLWGDEWGTVHWNQEAERQFYQLYREQQQPARGVPCSERKFVVIPQWHQGGFLSRYHEAIQLARRALLGGREIILDWQRLTIHDTGKDDWLGEGLNRYFMPFSQCQTDPWFLARITPEERKKWPYWNGIRQGVNGELDHAPIVFFDNWHKIDPEQGEWKGARWNPPHRKHMFEYGDNIKHPQRYKDLDSMLADRPRHDAEHVYPHPTSHRFRPSVWDMFDQNMHPQDRLSGMFVWYMLALWQWAPLPRIQAGSAWLRQFWASNLLDSKYELRQNPADTIAAYPKALEDSAAVIVRRGDKGYEDGYHKHHGHFRDISLYGWPLRRRMEKENKYFTSIFFMSDDAGLLAETQACSRRSHTPFSQSIGTSGDAPDPRGGISRGGGCRTEHAEIAFGGIPITFNAISPDPVPVKDSPRIGFEQFLVGLNYVIQYSRFVVGQTNSNVGRVVEEVMYAARQLDPAIESLHSVFEDAVDNYSGANTAGR